jgi:hypothetical protein
MKSGKSRLKNYAVNENTKRKKNIGKILKKKKNANQKKKSKNFKKKA